MSTDFNSAKSLINEMLAKTTAKLESSLIYAIRSQVNYLESVKSDTFRKLIGELDSQYTAAQHFKFQSSVRLTLQEMERTYLEYFGKPWDYEEPKEEAIDGIVLPKRGRPRKAK